MLMTFSLKPCRAMTLDTNALIHVYLNTLIGLICFYSL